MTTSVLCALLFIASCDALVPAAAHRPLPPRVLRPVVARVSELRASSAGTGTEEGAGRKRTRIHTKTAGRSKALGLCLLNMATFPSDVPRFLLRRMWYAVRLWFSLQRRLRLNHVLVATTHNGEVVGSVEVQTPQYMQRRAQGVYTPEQLAKLKPYLASLAVREDVRGRGIGRELVEAAVEAVRSSSYTGKYMLLGVEDNNTAAVRLYEGCGFETISPLGCQVRLMRKRVDVQPGRVMPGL